MIYAVLVSPPIPESKIPMLLLSINLSAPLLLFRLKTHIAILYSRHAEMKISPRISVLELNLYAR